MVGQAALRGQQMTASTRSSRAGQPGGEGTRQAPFASSVAARPPDGRGAGRPGPGRPPRGTQGGPCAVGTGAGSPRPGGPAGGAGGQPGAGAGADPVRADAGVAVHVLPGRGGRSWPPTWRPVRSRGSPSSSAAMRTCRTSACSARRSGGCIFDINDFDETLPGPWEWDVKRMAASFEVMGAVPRLLPRRPARGGHGRGARSTGSGCAGPRAWATLGAWYDQLEAGVLLEPGPPGGPGQAAWTRRRPGGRKSAWPRPTPATARGCSPGARLRSSGELRIVADPPLIVPIEDLAAARVASGRTPAR